MTIKQESIRENDGGYIEPIRCTVLGLSERMCNRTVRDLQRPSLPIFRAQQGISLRVVDDLHSDRVEFKPLTNQGSDVAQQEQFYHWSGVIKIG